MRLTLKIVVALVALMMVGVAYAEVPDVSKWSCPNGVVISSSDSPFIGTYYRIEVIECLGSGWVYIKVSGELVYIHEHRTDADKAVYYNALKTNEGNWVENVNKIDLFFKLKSTGIENNDIMIIITDDDGNIVAKRVIPLLKG